MALELKKVKHPSMFEGLAFNFINFSAVKNGTMEAYTIRSAGTINYSDLETMDALIVGGNRTLTGLSESRINTALSKHIPVITEIEFRSILRADKQGKRLLQKLRQMRNKPPKDFQPKTAQQLNALITKARLGASERIV